MTPRNLFPLAVLVANFAACQHSHSPPPRSNSPRQGYVLSSSMEPSLAGPVRWVRCSHCQMHWALALSSLDPARTPVCPSCHSQGVWDADEPGHLVTIDPIQPADFHVGDVIEFTDPNTEQPTVKRIVGLPGDTIRLQAGDLFVNEQRYRKGRQFLRQAILVHASSWPGPSPWIRIDPSKEHASILPPAYAFHSPPPAHEVPNSLIEPRPSQSPPIQYTPIQDDWWFNQGESLAPVDVHDVGTLFFFKSFHSLDLTLDLDHPTHPFRVHVQSLPNHSSHSLAVDFHLRTPSNDVPWSHQELTLDVPHSAQEPLWILIAHVDDQALVAFPTHTIIESFTAPPTNSLPAKQEASPPLIYRLHAADQLIETWVVRDAYLRLSPRSTDGILSTHDQSQGLILLGDNVGVSFDSRQTWPEGVLPNRVLGRIAPKTDLECLQRQQSLRYAK